MVIFFGYQRLFKAFQGKGLFEEYEKYKLKEILIDKLNLNEWDLDDDYVEEYKNKYLENKDYPPIVVDSDYVIIDGLHRANALKKSGLEKIMAFVGI